MRASQQQVLHVPYMYVDAGYTRYHPSVRYYWRVRICIIVQTKVADLNSCSSLLARFVACAPASILGTAALRNKLYSRGVIPNTQDERGVPACGRSAFASGGKALDIGAAPVLSCMDHYFRPTRVHVRLPACSVGAFVNCFCNVRSHVLLLIFRYRVAVAGRRS
jgi:hypothetical protein